MTHWRVLITDRAWPDLMIEQSVLEPAGVQIVDSPAGDEATLCRLAADVDAIATNWAGVTQRVITAAPRLKVIGRFGIGVDNIAVETATARGIPVVNCPDYCLSEVSDHTLGLLLACARRIAFFHLRTKRGEYNLQAAQGQQRLSTQTLGLIGLGRIGREVARKAQALGLHLLAFTPSGADYGTGCQMVSLEELLRSSDYVSLHLPLTDTTYHLINRQTLSWMKPTAYLINTSRGGLIDHQALWEALQQNRLAGAALDVFEPEPPDLSHPLFQDERIIATPHAAFVSAQALEHMRRQTCEQIVEVLQGYPPRNLINPQIRHIPPAAG
ncbi:MAG: dehydrogenase [Planctomycetaceae bacterium]|nr:MAG: dehydrogenase [Planctomycetaceae bacterium]